MKKIGHRRVTEGGSVTYKKTPTSDIQRAIQLGIQHSVSILQQKPLRDVLFRDFEVVETVDFPHVGTKTTPAHNLSDFRFRTFAPVAFRSFRNSFNLDIRDFLNSICDLELIELSNPGASGSIFYTSSDDEFIIKTVQHKEADFLQKLLPEYYMNLVQHTETLLPKFYGLYCYQSAGKNIRFVVMNNILPSSIQIHQKYDLKGSSYKRKANAQELSKSHPTLKDLDFKERHPEGIFLMAEAYDGLMNTLERDCLVLESFRIMDYSLLLGIHNLDDAERENLPKEQFSSTSWDNKICGDDKNQFFHRSVSSLGRVTHRLAPISEDFSSFSHKKCLSTSASALSGQKIVSNGSPQSVGLNGSSIQRKKNHSFSEASLTLPLDSKINVLHRALPARSSTGDRLSIYIGIIDILQSYRMMKKIEHSLKAIVLDANTVSVTNPAFYARRFQSTLGRFVFRKMQSPLSAIVPSQNVRLQASKPYKNRSLGSSSPLLRCSTINNLRARTTVSLPLCHESSHSHPIFFGSSSQLSWCAQSILSLQLDSDAATLSEYTNSSGSGAEDDPTHDDGATPTENRIDSDNKNEAFFFSEDSDPPANAEEQDFSSLDTILLAIQKVVRKQRSTSYLRDMCISDFVTPSTMPCDSASFQLDSICNRDQRNNNLPWNLPSCPNSVQSFMQAAENDFNLRG